MKDTKNNKNNYQKLKKIADIWIILALSFLATLYYVLTYRSMENPVTSDDAASQLYFYEHDILGADLDSGVVRRSFQISNILARISYAFFGANIKFTWFQNGSRYGILIVLALLLACSYSILSKKRESGIELWCIPIFFFFTVFQIPKTTDFGLNTARFHLDAIIAFLIYMIFCQKYESTEGKEKRKYGILSVIAIFYIFLQVDFVLIPAAIIPIAIREIYHLLKKEGCREKVFLVLESGIVLLAIIKIVSYVLNINTIYEGYGSRYIMGLGNIVANIIPLINSILDMFGINFSGLQVFSLDFIFLIPKIVIFICFVAIWIEELSYLIRYRKSRDMVVSLCSISILMLILFTLILCPITSPIEGRYMAGVLYLLPIVTCRFFSRNLEIISDKLHISKSKVRKDIVFVVCGVSVLFVNIPEKRVNISYENMALSLAELGFDYGVGDFWTANITSLLTNQQTMIQAVNFDYNEYKLVPYMDEWDYYTDKEAQYNFITIDANPNMRMGLEKEKYSDIYGNYEREYCFDGNVILAYNYDIRSIPRELYVSSDDWNEDDVNILQKKSEMQFISEKNELRIGKYRIEWHGDNLESAEIDAFVDGEKMCTDDIRIISKDDAVVVCEVDMYKNSDDVAFVIESAEEKIEIEKQMIYCVNQSQKIESVDDGKRESGEYLCYEIENVERGDYQIIIKAQEGKDIHNLEFEISCDGNSIEKDMINVGKEKIVAQFSVESGRNVKVEINDKSEETLEIESVNIASNEKQKFCSVIPYWALSSTGNNVTNGKIELNQGEIQYGPYIDVEKGRYLVQVIGDNFDNVNISLLYTNGKVIDVTDASINKNSLMYIVNLPKDVSGLEFRVENQGSEMISIEKVIVEAIE